MKSVLFIEDNNDLCQIYSQVMEYQDDVTSSFAQTKELILAAMSKDWDLIVSDCDVPGITIDEIRSLAKCKIVFLTGGSDSLVLKPGEKVYQKQNLVKLLPLIMKENL